jgi:hypothetical protein
VTTPTSRWRSSFGPATPVDVPLDAAAELGHLIEVIGEAISQIPAGHRRNLLVTIDGAGASHAVVKHLATLDDRPGHRVHYSVGMAVDARVRNAIGQLPEGAWDAALAPDGAGSR